MNSMKRQNDITLKDEPLRSVGVQYATGEKQKNSSRRNEKPEPKWKQQPVVDGSGGESQVRGCKEQPFMGIWNARSLSQGKLEVVKQDMARVNIDILGISELNGREWMSLFQMTIVSATMGKNPLEEMK